MSRGMTARRSRARLLILAGGTLAAVLVLAPTLGSTAVSLRDVWADPFDWSGNPAAAIFFVARLPRVLLAAVVGGSLA
ncbi:MAG: iron ABC transporter permease, partial [Gammaproteobacteria bacterium]|nr:iron ABC transporter permease [Gammaproteobacteria bacterium]